MSGPQPAFEHRVSRSVRAFAVGFPEAAEGSSCVNRAFSAGGKNFAFYAEMGDTCTLRLKTRSNGWTKIVFDADDAPAEEELQALITESFTLLAPPRVVRLLDE